jgi:hypothetical protein
MFNSGILDVVIGLVVIYLQLSLVCTAFNELIASGLKSRAKELEKGLGALLTDPQLLDKFYAHPLIKALRPDGKKPSYIPSHAFAMTLMDIVRRHSFDGAEADAAKKVAATKTAEGEAQAWFKQATSQLETAIAASTAADQAFLSVVDPTEKVIATEKAGRAKNEQTRAQNALTDAAAKLTVAEQALSDAASQQQRVRTEITAATEAEGNAQKAEAAAKENPKDENLKQDAATARQRANSAAENLAPNAAGLLSEARDRVAGAQTNVVPPELKTALLALMDHAGEDLKKAQANLEQWFNDAMDRVSGVYKRKSQVWIVIIAVLVTIFANVDSLQVADSLSQDKALRESLVAAAPELAKSDKDRVDKERGTIATPTPTPATSDRRSAEIATANGAPNPSVTPTPIPSPTTEQTPSLGNIKASLDEIKKLGVPIGYVRVCTPGEATLVEHDCPNKGEFALIEAETGLKHAQGDLDQAIAAIEKRSAAQAAQKLALEHVKAATAARDEAIKAKSKQQEAEAALKTAQDQLDKANADLGKTDGDQLAIKAAQDLAAARVEKEKKARDEAIKAVATAKQIEATAILAQASAQSAEAEAKKAEADAEAAPEDPNKKKVATDKEETAKKLQKDADVAQRAADNQKESLRIECPKCRKESELSAGELKRRMPTTHGYRLLEDFGSAISALVSDSWHLLYFHWLGWMLTILAISLGAPFWFDTLNRLMVIRSALKPGERDTKGDKGKEPEKT